jgi:hypothetical protein
MNTDVEDLLRDGMERFTERVSAPAGLASAAGTLHRRRTAIRATLASSAATVVAVSAVIAVVAVANTSSSRTEAQTVAYLTSQIRQAVASENMVYVGHTTGTFGPTTVWAYGKQSQWVEYWPTADYRDRVVNGQRLWDFPPQDRGKAYSSEGTARVGGTLMGAYVVYPDQKYTLSRQLPAEGSACTTTGSLELGGPAVVDVNWKSFIEQMLACGAASAAGRVRVDGVETTKITGKPVTVRLAPAYGRAVRENWITVRWALYVNPATYLPVRIVGSTKSYGGKAGTTISSATTNVQWLRPTKANIAKTLVTIPPGFQQVGSAAGV